MTFVDTVKTFFAAGLGATAGYMAFMLCVSLYALIFAGGGYYVLRKNNKTKDDGTATPLFKELTGMQYVGLGMMALGLAPFLVYFFQALMLSFGFEAGSALFEQMSD